MTDPSTERPRTSTRDLDQVLDRLTRWLDSRYPDTHPGVGNLTAPQANGMSSETLLFDVTTSDAGGRTRVEHCVARLAPSDDALPIFPEYDMERQFRVMRLVGERTSVPVPDVLWYEGDPGVLGAPFFVMQRADGLVPPDIMPYTFGDNWLFSATEEQRARLQSSTMAVVAGVHGVSGDDLAFLGEATADGDAALRAHVDGWREYYEWAHGEHRIPVLERGFEWIDANWPEEVGAPVLSWGDSRIGNVMYRDFEAVAVLDWEMAGIGPRELDLGWLSFLHRFFQELAEFFELPGMPGFLDFGAVADEYAALTGYRPRDLRFYETYAALRHGVVMGRVNQRRVRFGEQELPDDPDDLVNHKATLAAMIDGS